MAQITADGVRARTLAEYIELLGQRFRNALGSNLALDPETPQGQIIGELALVFTEMDEAMVAQGNALSLSLAAGQQLDDIGSALGIPRIDAQRSTVTATFAGAPNTIVPSGTRAQTTGGSDLFETFAVARIGSSGTADIPMRSTVYGAVPAPVGTLTRFLVQVEGVDTVTNAAAATLGRLRETDDEYRARYRRELAINARGSRDALRSALLAVPGVTDLAIIENATNASTTVRGETVAAHSVLLHVLGGADDAVTAAITANLPFGITYVHTRPTAIPVSIGITTRFEAGFATDGIQQIKDAVKEFIDGLPFTQGTAAAALYRSIYSVTGHTLTTDPTITRKTGSEGVGTADLDGNEYLTVLPADITVTLAQ